VSEATKEELLFGRIAIHNGLVDQAKIDQALAVRAKRKDDSLDLGRILKAKGFIDDKQYKACRKAQEKHLIQKGLSADQARLAARGLSGEAGLAALAREDAGQDGNGDVGEAASASPAPAKVAVEEMAPDEVAPEEAQEVVAVEPSPPPAPEPAPAAASEKKETVPARAVEKRVLDEAAKKAILGLLKKARDAGASDLHLSAGSKPFLRLHGKIEFLNLPALTSNQNKSYFAQLLNDKQWAHYMEKNDIDVSIDLGKDGGRFRTNLMKQRRGYSGVFRVIKAKVPTLAELGLPQSLEKFTTYSQGLALITGPAGCGKSSTLAALIELINESRHEHIITLEDPIEYIFAGKKCNVMQRQVEVHTQSWANALRASTREDPDVVMIGEMRDLETVSLAITAAETGHLVFGTLHTTNATRTIDRVLDVFPPKEQAQIRAMVSESMRGVVSQQLVPRADGQGRVAALEILYSTPAVGNLIREKRTFQLFSVMQTGRKLGMQLMDDALMDYVKAGTITKDEAKRRAQNPKLFG